MRTLLLSALAGFSCLQGSGAGAADLDYGILRGSTYEPTPVVQTDMVALEAFAGYLNVGAGESVYDVRANNAKLSQLNWNADAAAVGGRIAVRPLDWLTVRARGWAAVDSRGDMTDYDWLAGYFGKSSWTHYSQSPNTRLAKAWQGDLSLAASVYDDGELGLTALAGYRYFTAKWNAVGGSGIYSVNAFRDTPVTFPGNQLGIAYQQTFETPYLGVGASYSSDDWTMTTEVIGSPFAVAHARDHHVLRSLLFTDNLGTAGFVGVGAGLEYRVTPLVSVTGRVEYQKYLLAKGSEKAFDATSGTSTAYAAPSAGGEAETLLLSLGVKARL